MRARTKIGKRIVSLLLATLCMTSVIPATAITAYAADVPSQTTLGNATFIGNYSSASFSGSVGLHKMTMDMGPLDTM